MLTFEQPAREIEGVLLFADHAVPTQFYYLAPNPAVARVGGRPLFDLYLYTVALEHSVLSGTQLPDELGAGFLNMGVECVIPESRLGTVRARLADQLSVPEQTLTLAPVPYTGGTVRVIALDQMQQLGGDEPAAPAADGRVRFVEQIIGGATPSLLGNLRSIFSLRLSQNGAAFLEGLYSQDAAPVGVVYDLEFYGLRPAVDVTIRANLSRVQKHFGAGLGGQIGWFKPDISASLDEMVENGDIDIDITRQMTGPEAEESRKLALDLFKERIVQEMFRPSAPLNNVQQATSALTVVTGTLTNATNTAAGANVTLTLKANIRHEDKVVTYNFSERMPEKRTHAPQAFLPLLVSPTVLQERIIRVNLDNDFFQTVNVLATGPTAEEFAALGIRQVAADFTYGDKRQTLLFRADNTGDKPFAAKRNGRPSLAYDVRLTYDFLPDNAIDGDAFQYVLPAETRTGQSLLINPRRDFGLLTVEVEAGRIHPTVKELDVALHYAAPDGRFAADEHFRLPLPQTERPRWRVRTADPIDPHYTATTTYVFDDGTVWTAPPADHTDPLLRIDAPFQHERSLLIRPNVIADDVAEIDVEVEYEDVANAYRRRFLVKLTPPFTGTELRWPILDPNAQRIRTRETTFEPGFTHEGEWLETSDGSLIVGAKNSRAAAVTVRIIGDPLDVAQIDALLVILEQLDADNPARHDLFFAPSDPMLQKAEFTIPPGGALRYQWRTQTFKQDGSVAEADWTVADAALLVISTRNL